MQLSECPTFRVFCPVPQMVYRLSQDILYSFVGLSGSGPTQSTDKDALSGISAMSKSQSPTTMQVRIARPTDKLQEVVAFYRDALGLPVIGHFEDHAGYSGVMLGMSTDHVHLEFTHADAGSPCPAPSKDNLLVFYLPNAERYFSVLQRMTHYGHSPAEPENPYWKAKSKTFEDPDGWRVVLYNGSPFGAG